MKIISCLDISNNLLDELYDFLMRKNNFNNKANLNNILWDVIYLRKIFNKSIKSRVSKNNRGKYNYILTNNNEILCFFSLHYIKKDNYISITDLTIIINKDSYDNKDYQIRIINMIIDTFTKISENFTGLNILAIYIPNNLLELENNFRNNTKINFGFVDNMTYQDEYNVFFNTYSNNLKDIKMNEYSKGQIIELLMNEYGVNTIVNPVREISKKLTRKSMELPELKVITKNIFDIKEIQDLPEYDYDYIKVYSLKFYTFISYLLNVNKPNIDKFIMDRYFYGSLEFNKNIYNLYKTIFTFIYENINIQKIKNSLFNIDYLLKINNIFIINMSNLYFEQIYKTYKNNKLLICNFTNVIDHFTKYNIDIIKTKSLFNKNEESDRIFKRRNNIMIANNNHELNNIFKINNKTYSFILIEIYYPSYDYLITNINLISKISYILYTILNSLKYIILGGDLFLSMNLGNFNIPSIKKTFDFILSLFNEYKCENIAYNRNYILLKNFKGLKEIELIKINKLLKIFNGFENVEFKHDDIYNLILSNKFTYKYIHNSIKTNFIKTNQYKLPYDIKGLNPIKHERIIKFYKKYNKMINYNNKIDIENNNIFDDKDIDSKIIKRIKQNYIFLFKFINKKNLFENEDIQYMIKFLEEESLIKE
jgi:hypothetical protein